MMHRFPTRAAALRSLKDISVDAIQHAKQLITEEDGMFCFDEDTAEQYLNSQSENNLEIAMTTSITNVKTATTAQLVEFYNDHAESSIKKFRDRATAEARCQAILDAIAKEEPVVEKDERTQEDRDAVFAIFAQPVSIPLQPVPALTEEERLEDIGDVFGYETHGLTRCPKCGIHLSNGVGAHLQEANGKLIKHDKYEFCCLGCGEEFGPSIHKASESEGERAPSVTQADTMKTSLKLDRTITCTETELVWKNAYQMWKANPTWMTSSQQDTLTAKLYAAAKKGEKLVVEINGRHFYLCNV